MKKVEVGDYVFAKVVRPESLPEKYREGVVTKISRGGTMQIKTPQGEYLCFNNEKVIVVRDKDLFGEIKEFVLRARRSLRDKK